MAGESPNTIQQIDQLLTRGVGTFVDPKNIFRSKLIKKSAGTYTKPIFIKFGVDVTRPDIHLGHATILRTLRGFQDIGCTVVFLIGDFTTLIGDPTGKSKTRPEVDREAIETNMRTYLDQVGKILRVERDASGNILNSPAFSWIRNADWFFGVSDIAVEGASKNLLTITDDATGHAVSVPSGSFIAKAALYENTRMQKTVLRRPTTYSVSLVNLLAVLRHISHAQLIERDMFQERIAKGEPLFAHELLYPVIQGVDSSIIADVYGSCDLEIGGTDQVFNMLMGRKVMEIAGKEPQAVLGMEILTGLDGKEKMSKSLNNYIGVFDAPGAMFGKVMSLPDSLIVQYFELCTYTPMADIQTISDRLSAQKANPMDSKLDLAQQIVEIYHGQEAGVAARRMFIDTFQKKALPDEMTVINATTGEILADVVIRSGLVSSKAEYRRLLDSGAIKENGEQKISDPKLVVQQATVLRVGKHRFLKIVLA